MFQNFDVQNKLSLVASEQYSDVFYEKQTNTLFIPRNHINYLELSTFIQKYFYSDLRILSTCLINEEIILAIKNNPHLVFVRLGSKNDPYTLTRSVFDVLNASDSLFSIYTDSVLGEYNTEEMGYLPFFEQLVVQKYSISNLLTDHEFSFYESINAQELEYLKKYLPNEVSIYFHYGDYANIIQVIQALEDKQIRFYLQKCDDLSIYSKEFSLLLNRGETVNFMQDMDFSQYIKIDMLLELMVKDIKESHLSPYGKYLGVYEIVTHFKGYLENEENFKDARELEYLLFNDFYVCYGISELMKALLDKVGIKSYNVKVDFYKEKEQLDALEQAKLDKQLLYQELNHQNYISPLLKKVSNTAHHSRLLVKLNDSKYDIDGIFIADPTWDNSQDRHLFSYSLMTFYEMKLELVEFYETDVSIFGVTNTKEYMELIERRSNAIPYFLTIIKVIDPNYYDYLVNTYQLNIRSMDMIMDIYHYIIRYTKHPVSKDNKNKAIEVLFTFIYPFLTEKEREKIFWEIYQDNNMEKGKER